MPAIREHLSDIESAPVYDVDLDVDEDDDMPPLVDNPNPSMTFTFFTDMTPITAFTADPTLAYANNNADEYANNRPSSYPRSAQMDMDIHTSRKYAEFTDDRGESQGQLEPHDSFESQGQMHEQGFSFYDPQPYAGRQTHAKKRDASYIPRPPNAFILFRSSFIRSQQVPEKVEGNHSTLSKIIGKYWKTLPRSEREVWEAKALLAQAEHRRRYPDWRFRPGANALVKAKMKVKDGPGTGKNKDKGGGRSGSNIKGERGKDSNGKKGDAKGYGDRDGDKSKGDGVDITRGGEDNGINRDRRGSQREDESNRGYEGSADGGSRLDEMKKTKTDAQQVDIGAQKVQDASQDSQDQAQSIVSAKTLQAKPKADTKKRKRAPSLSATTPPSNKRTASNISSKRPALPKALDKRAVSKNETTLCSTPQRRKMTKDERCALIAGLLVEGKKGRALQDAVEKWEAEGISVSLEVDGQFGMKEDEGGAKKDKRAWEINKRIGDGCNGDLERDRECGTKRVADLVGKVGMKKSVDKNDATVGGAHGDTDAPIRDHIPTCMDVPSLLSISSTTTTNLNPSIVNAARSKTPIDTRFKVPLTAMFKRSVSAPVPVSGAGALGANASEDAPSPSINYASPPSLLHSRQDSFGSVISDDTTASNSPVTPTDDYESEPNRGSYEYGTLSPLMLPGSTVALEAGMGTKSWEVNTTSAHSQEYIITSENSGFGANRKSSPNPGSNAKRSPALIAYSPSMSPLASAFGTYGYSPDMGYGKGINGYEHDYTQAQDETGTYSSYSTLQGWNSVEMSNFGESNDNCHSNTGCFSSIDMGLRVDEPGYDTRVPQIYGHVNGMQDVSAPSWVHSAMYGAPIAYTHEFTAYPPTSTMHQPTAPATYQSSKPVKSTYDPRNFAPVDSGLVYGSAMPVMYEWSSVTDTMNTRDITRPQTGRRNEDTFSGDAGWA